MEDVGALGVYFREKPLTYEGLTELGAKLRHWYFEYGMFLSDSYGSGSDGLKRYFFLQDLIVVMVIRQKGCGELPCQGPLLYAEADDQDFELFSLFNVPKPDRNTKWEEQLYQSFTPDATARKPFRKRLGDSSEKHFALIRCATSALRTQMVKDLGSRERPEF
jgi:hypothetical protein